MAAIDVEHFSANVRAICDSERGTLSRLAENAGITVPYLSDVTHGKKKPSLEVAVDIARALGISLDALMAPPRQFAKKFAKAS